MYRLPLASYRVLDLGPTSAVSYAARLLGDGGAEAIKVEREPVERTGLFRQLNRDKLGCLFDFGLPEGRDTLRRLVSRCDVVIEGYEPAERERLGLTYEALSEARPDIILASITGTRPGASTPLDIVAGTAAAAAVSAALMHHRDSGEGQHVEVDARECAASFQGVGRASLSPPQDLLSNDQLRKRGFLEPVSSRSESDEMPALPWRFSLTPCHVRLPAPGPGEHNRYVFEELLGLTSTTT
jgi:crotonobetainyl-CoA:carnitine CoA-transferase CaiB-like acyl-CoA transferase